MVETRKFKCLSICVKLQNNITNSLSFSSEVHLYHKNLRIEVRKAIILELNVCLNRNTITNLTPCFETDLTRAVCKTCMPPIWAVRSSGSHCVNTFFVTVNLTFDLVVVVVVKINRGHDQCPYEVS